MSKYDAEAGYKNLIETNTEVQSLYTEIINTLLRNNTIDSTSGDLASVINGLSNQALTVNFPNAVVQEYLTKVNELTNRLEKFNNHHEQSNYFDISKAIGHRKAERNDAWKLWRDKLGRWTMGVLVAVLIYSALVALSKWTGWLVIHVRDLVVSG